MYRNRANYELLADGTSRGHISRCQVPANHYFVQQSFTMVCAQVLAFVKDAGRELCLFFNDVGTNAQMQALLRNAGICWDFEHLVCRVGCAFVLSPASLLE